MNNIYKKNGLVLVCCFILATSIWVFGHRQLGGFDMSALIDTGWRMANGQQPYHDFLLTTPIVFYVGAGWAIQLFGAKWSAFVIAEIIMAVAGFLAQAYLLKRLISWKNAIAIAFVCQALCSVVTSYWWYNSITITAACLFISAAYVFINEPSSRTSTISLWGTLTFLSITKPNIAGVLAVLVFLALLIFSPQRVRLVLIYFISFITFLLLLTGLHINPLDVIRSYAQLASGRGTPSISWFFLDKQLEYLITVPLILLSFVPVLTALMKSNPFRANIKQNGYLAITMVCLLAGFVSLLTNSDSNLVVGIPFFMLTASVFPLLFSHEIQPQQTTFNRFTWIYLLTCGLVAFTAGMMRWRVLYIGPGAFYTDSKLVSIPDVPFFENFQVSPRARSVVTEINSALKQTYGTQDKWKNAPVYFGARIEFSYAAFGIASPKYLPIWWHPNNSYAVIYTNQAIQSFFDHHFDICIFMLSHDNQPDFGFLPAPVVYNIKENYNRVDSSSIAVYYRNK